MSFIEGIGDDLLCVFICLLFIGLVSLAWLSTHVNHIHLPRTLFIIERRSTRRRTDEESEPINPTPPSPKPAAPPPSSTTEHESDNESSEVDEFHADQPPPSNDNPSSESAHHPPTTASDEDNNQSLRITIKFLNDTQKQISANSNDTISKIKQLHFADDLSNNKLIRFIYQGRELQDQETLRTSNIRDQTIIHCQISARRNPPPRGTPPHVHIHRNSFDPSALIDSSPVNISSHFVLLLTLVLGFIWLLRINYRLLFSPISTVILILITILFLIFTCGSLLTTRRQLSNTPSTTIAVTPILHPHSE